MEEYYQPSIGMPTLREGMAPVLLVQPWGRTFVLDRSSSPDSD